MAAICKPGVMKNVFCDPGNISPGMHKWVLVLASSTNTIAAAGTNKRFLLWTYWKLFIYSSRVMRCIAIRFWLQISPSGMPRTLQLVPIRLRCTSDRFVRLIGCSALIWWKRLPSPISNNWLNWGINQWSDDQVLLNISCHLFDHQRDLRFSAC